MQRFGNDKEGVMIYIESKKIEDTLQLVLKQKMQ